MNKLFLVAFATAILLTGCALSEKAAVEQAVREYYGVCESIVIDDIRDLQIPQAYISNVKTVYGVNYQLPMIEQPVVVAPFTNAPPPAYLVWRKDSIVVNVMKDGSIQVLGNVLNRLWCKQAKPTSAPTAKPYATYAGSTSVPDGGIKNPSGPIYLSATPTLTPKPSGSTTVVRTSTPVKK